MQPNPENLNLPPLRPERDYSPFCRLDEELKHIFSSFKVCIHCQKPRAKNLCTGCRGVFYCSRQCQVDHWKYHKGCCKGVQDAFKLLEKETKHRRKLIEQFAYGNGMNELDVELLMKDLYTKPDIVPNDAPEEIREKYLDLLLQLYEQSSGHSKKGGSTAMVKRSVLVERSLLQAVYQALYHSVDLLCYRLDRKDSYSMFEVIPDFLLRLQQDQMAIDFISWNMMFLLVEGPKENPHSKNLECLPRYFPLYPLRDRSNPEIIDDLIELVKIDQMPFYHVLSLIQIKTRLYIHWVNMDAFYTFLQCMDKISIGGGIVDPALVCGRLSGCQAVLHHIRNYLIDSDMNLPSSKFVVTGKNAMKEQIESLLRAIPKVKSGNVIYGWLNGSLPVALGGTGELPPMLRFMNCFPKPIKTCFIHDMESREVLNKFVQDLNL